MQRKFQKTILYTVILITSFICGMNTSIARDYYYFTSLTGLIDSNSNIPFDGSVVAEAVGNVKINIDDIVIDQSDTNKEIDFSITASGDINPDEVSLYFKLSNENIIAKDNVIISGTGINRKISISRAISDETGETHLSIFAAAGNTQEATKHIDITVSSTCDNPIDAGGHAILCNSHQEYLLSSDKDLLHISKYQSDSAIGERILNGTFQLTKSISFDSNESNVDWDNSGTAGDNNDNEGWTPIGNPTNKFKGKILGNGKTISNLYINRPSSDYQGFIGYSDLGKIYDIGLKNAYIKGKDNVGGLGGHISFVSNSYVKGEVRGTHYIGGILGDASYSYINNCYTDAQVIGTSEVGGIVGGKAPSYINNSYSAGNISGSSYVGGLVGKSASNLAIKNSYSTASVSASSLKGGLVGGGDININNENNLCEYHDESTITICNSENANLIRNKGSISLWEDKLWEDLNDINPKLEWEVAGNIDSKIAFDNIPSACDSSNPLENIYYDGNSYVIGGENGNSKLAEKQLLCLSQLQTYESMSANYKLNADVDFGDKTSVDWDGDGNLSSADDSKGWNPIGVNESNIFLGNFNGQGHYIKNIYINRPSSNQQGFLGKARGSYISNLSILNITVTGNENVGGLIGSASYSTLHNNSVTGNITGNSKHVGGLSGSASNVSQCYADVNVIGKSTHVGGLLGGSLTGYTVKNSYSSGTVNGTSDLVGGLIGYGQSNIENCYSTAKVTGQNSYVGGLAGYGYKVLNSYATGNVSGASQRIGGLVGNLTSLGFLTNSYATGNVTGISGVGRLVGVSFSKITNSYGIGTVSGSVNVGSLAGYSSVSPANEGGYCDEVQSVATVCNASQISTIQTGSTYGAWDSESWNLGSSEPSLKNMPN
ncbi:MAG: hypothetical protein OIF36_00615 [Alphaproteobacteria bacterium]|nr:hypothetical protein [Alphaproteobacteria bacterium]